MYIQKQLPTKQQRPATWGESNMILWSIRTFWYKGSAENKEQKTCSQKMLYLSKIVA